MDLFFYFISTSFYNARYNDFRNYIPYSQVEKFIITGDTMYAGAHFIVWGEK